MIRDPSLLYFIVPAGIALGFMLPADSVAWPLRVFTVVTCLAVGVAFGTRSARPISVAMGAIWSWAILASLTVASEPGLRSGSPDGAVWSKLLTLQVSNVLTILALATGLTIVVRGGGYLLRILQGRARNAAYLLLVALYMVLDWTVGASGDVFPLPWSGSGPPAVRSWLIFDLLNGLWIAIVFPLFVMSSSERWWKSTAPRRGTEKPVRRAAWVMAPFLYVAWVIVVSELVGWEGGFERLSINWWLRKAAMIAIWNAAIEEIAWRVVVIEVLSKGFRGISERNLHYSIVVAAVLFGLTHWPHGLLTVSLAVGLGIVFSASLWRGRSIVALVSAHLLINLYSMTWTIG